MGVPSSTANFCDVSLIILKEWKNLREDFLMENKSTYEDGRIYDLSDLFSFSA